jgi:DNA-binding transcriptional regulator YiaG
VTVRIPDLEVIACTNPQCRPENPGDSIIHDEAATWRITEETYRQLGLLTPAEIRAGRERLKLTQQELQSLLGLGGNSLSRWENGHIYQARSMDTLLRISFGVPEALDFARHVRHTGEPCEEEHGARFPDLDASDRVVHKGGGRRPFTPAGFLAGAGADRT